MESRKRHKRSGSEAKAVIPAPTFRKKAMGAQSHGKFQTSTKPRVEKKNFDTSGALTTFNTLAALTPVCINLINAGTTGITAVGRRILMRSIHVRCSVIATSGATGANTCRLVCVYDRQATGSLASAASVFGSTTDNVSAGMNLNYSDRFSIIFDEKFILGPAGTDNGAYILDRYVKVRLPVVAVSNQFTGAIGGINEGSVICYCISQNIVGPPALSPPAIQDCFTRIRFTDV